jgi:hypothetical protein
VPWGRTGAADWRDLEDNQGHQETTNLKVSGRFSANSPGLRKRWSTLHCDDAGGGMGKSNIDVEVSDLQAGLALVRRVLGGLKVAASTVIYAQQGDRSKGTGQVTTYRVYEQP